MTKIHEMTDDSIVYSVDGVFYHFNRSRRTRSGCYWFDSDVGERVMICDDFGDLVDRPRA